MSTIPLQTKLGCQFRCVYCTYRKIEGTHYRLSDPAQVADTVSGLSKRGLKHIEFVDNVFNSPYEHAMSICERLAAADHGASLQSLELNPLFIDDNLITEMERAGFSGIGITVESASDIVLGGLRKGFGAAHVYRSAEVIKRHSLPCVWIFMLGGPGETRETVRETLRFARDRIRPGDVAFFGIGIRIYPGTELENIARREGLLSLSPRDMLQPVFYISPAVGYFWIIREIQTLMDRAHERNEFELPGVSFSPGDTSGLLPDGYPPTSLEAYTFHTERIENAGTRRMNSVWDIAATPGGNAHIASIGLAVPAMSIDQPASLDHLMSRFSGTLKQRSISLMRKLFEHPGIRKRHFAIEDPVSFFSESPDDRIRSFHKVVD